MLWGSGFSAPPFRSAAFANLLHLVGSLGFDFGVLHFPDTMLISVLRIAHMCLPKVKKIGQVGAHFDVAAASIAKNVSRTSIWSRPPYRIVKSLRSVGRLSMGTGPILLSESMSRSRTGPIALDVVQTQVR